MKTEICTTDCQHARGFRVSFGGEVFKGFPDKNAKSIMCDLRKDDQRFTPGVSTCWRKSHK